MAKNVSEGRFGVECSNISGGGPHDPQLNSVVTLLTHTQFLFMGCVGALSNLVIWYLILDPPPPPSSPCDRGFSVGSDKILQSVLSAGIYFVQNCSSA